MSATMDYKQMRSYTHEDLINLLSNLDEKQLLKFSAKHGGYPGLLRMALDDRISHIPLIQTGAAILRQKEWRFTTRTIFRRI